MGVSRLGELRCGQGQVGGELMVLRSCANGGVGLAAGWLGVSCVVCSRWDVRWGKCGCAVHRRGALHGRGAGEKCGHFFYGLYFLLLLPARNIQQRTRIECKVDTGWPLTLCGLSRLRHRRASTGIRTADVHLHMACIRSTMRPSEGSTGGSPISGGMLAGRQKSVCSSCSASSESHRNLVTIMSQSPLDLHRWQRRRRRRRGLNGGGSDSGGSDGGGRLLRGLHRARLLVRVRVRVRVRVWV